MLRDPKLFLCMLLATSAGALPSIAESPALHQSGSGHDSPSSPVQDLNNEFRTIYANAKKERIAQLDPIIICHGSKVILLHAGRHIEEDFLPPNYSLLKTIDHTPLAVYVFLNSKTDRALAADELAELLKLKTLILNAMPFLKPSGLPETILARQKKVLGRAVALIDDAAAHKQVSSNQLNEFCSALGRDMLDTAYDDASIELSALNKIVRKWKHEMTPQEWSSLRVVVTGAHMARKEERHMQYFQRLLNEKEEGHHLIFVEGSDDDAKDLDLLATHELDRGAGQAFFHDAWRLHKDLLADGAKRYLDEHPEEP